MAARGLKKYILVIMLNIYREALQFYNHQDDLSSDDEDENESEDESDEE